MKKNISFNLTSPSGNNRQMKRFFRIENAKQSSFRKKNLHLYIINIDGVMYGRAYISQTKHKLGIKLSLRNPKSIYGFINVYFTAHKKDGDMLSMFFQQFAEYLKQENPHFELDNFDDVFFIKLVFQQIYQKNNVTVQKYY